MCIFRFKEENTYCYFYQAILKAAQFHSLSKKQESSMCYLIKNKNQYILYIFQKAKKVNKQNSLNAI